MFMTVPVALLAQRKAVPYLSPLRPQASPPGDVQRHCARTFPQMILRDIVRRQVACGNHQHCGRKMRSAKAVNPKPLRSGLLRAHAAPIM